MTRTQAKKGFFTSPPYTSVVTPTADGTQSKDKSPSPHFIKLVEEWADSYIKSTELPAIIIEEAKKEQLSDEVAKATIECALRKRGLSERRIAQLIPSELKNPLKITKKPAIPAALIAADRAEVKHDSEDTFDEQIDKDVPVTNIIDNRKTREEIIEGLPPEMQAIAAKISQPDENIDSEVIGRYALFEPKKTAEVLTRDLGRLKSSGWKVVEITARLIT